MKKLLSLTCLLLLVAPLSLQSAQGVLGNVSNDDDSPRKPSTAANSESNSGDDASDAQPREATVTKNSKKPRCGSNSPYQLWTPTSPYDSVPRSSIGFDNKRDDSPETEEPNGDGHNFDVVSPPGTTPFERRRNSTVQISRPSDAYSDDAESSTRRKRSSSVGNSSTPRQNPPRRKRSSSVGDDTHLRYGTKLHPDPKTRKRKKMPHLIDRTRQISRPSDDPYSDGAKPSGRRPSAAQIPTSLCDDFPRSPKSRHGQELSGDSHRSRKNSLPPHLIGCGIFMVGYATQIALERGGLSRFISKKLTNNFLLDGNDVTALAASLVTTSAASIAKGNEYFSFQNGVQIIGGEIGIYAGRKLVDGSIRTLNWCSKKASGNDNDLINTKTHSDHIKVAKDMTGHIFSAVMYATFSNLGSAASETQGKSRKPRGPFSVPRKKYKKPQ